ncbi:META domain-containing protein [Halomonas campisalis]|uniref:META domain-containing protein n=1 Tax=Billgrantia campisalis TaxID=74661 RepID=A0ABS9PBJ0_9GAMM|nr:META domain-containing protein [Halomonas campisalis]MCG6658612.1 META domain-containing protein [Halomonas campisalis]MDR5863474.1 META domain-containing protein [Halomonas campisalis]
MNNTTLGRSLLLAVAAVTLAACGSQPTDTSRDRDALSGDLEGPVVGQRWNLLLVGTDERLSMPQPAHFTISPDGRVTGSDGCNQMNGRVRLGESQRIEFSQLATTRRACPQAEDAARVTGMLETAYRYLIDHDRLVFFGPDQRVLGGFRRAD